MSEGIVKIHDKEYQTVAYRISKFREKFSEYSIVTDVQNAADLVCVKCTISNERDRVIATGYAEEVRNSTSINKTSALENCETSAVGRALAFFGLGGTEIASANEVSDAVIAGAKKEVGDYFISYNSCVSEHIHTISQIKASLAEGYLVDAAGPWFDLPEDVQQRLFCLAPTKGGVFTTKERETMKSSEFRKAYFGEDGE